MNISKLPPPPKTIYTNELSAVTQNNNKIPKIIHWCWFSGDKTNRFVRNCIKTWEKVMPDYQIRLWDAHSFDFHSVPFVYEAFKAKKWAFVADYIRLYALYTEGGIYLDSDVKTYKRFDTFLNNEMFIGLETLSDGTVELESAIMGSIKGHPYLKECMELYENMHFNFETVPTCPELMTSVLKKYGMQIVNKNQLIDAGKQVKILNLDYFGHLWGTKPGNYYAVHYYTASWRTTPRGKLYRWCRDNDYMNHYLRLQNLILKFKH